MPKTIFACRIRRYLDIIKILKVLSSVHSCPRNRNIDGCFLYVIPDIFVLNRSGGLFCHKAYMTKKSPTEVGVLYSVDWVPTVDLSASNQTRQGNHSAHPQPRPLQILNIGQNPFRIDTLDDDLFFSTDCARNL